MCWRSKVITRDDALGSAGHLKKFPISWLHGEEKGKFMASSEYFQAPKFLKNSQKDKWKLKFLFLFLHILSFWKKYMVPIHTKHHDQDKTLTYLAAGEAKQI